MTRKDLAARLIEINSFDINLVLDESHKFRVKSFVFDSIDEILCSLDYAIRTTTFGVRSLNLASDQVEDAHLQKEILSTLFKSMAREYEWN